MSILVLLQMVVKRGSIRKYNYKLDGGCTMLLAMKEQKERTPVEVAHRIIGALNWPGEKRNPRTQADVLIEDAITKTVVARVNRVLAERRYYQKSVGEAADVITGAQILIEAGVRYGNSEAVEAGRNIWKEVWPKEVVDIHVDLFIEDIKEEMTTSRHS